MRLLITTSLCQRLPFGFDAHLHLDNPPFELLAIIQFLAHAVVGTLPYFRFFVEATCVYHALFSFIFLFTKLEKALRQKYFYPPITRLVW